MENKYQESLDLFEKIYFNEKGRLDRKSFYEPYYKIDSEKYVELGKDVERDYRSKIVGKSVFTPKIICQKNDDPTIGYNYFLTLDEQGQFDHHCLLIFGNAIKKIDVTSMSREEIMTIVEQMLNMSNEEIMTMFNIKQVYSPNIKIGLILDDVVQKYSEQQGQELQKYYGPEGGIRIKSEKEEINISERDNGFIQILSSQDSEPVYESVSYKVLSGRESNLDKIRLDIEKSNVNSRLGKLILETLEERFTERQIEEEKVESKTEQTGKEKTGAEKIIEFMRQNNLESNDLALALSMSLARTTDKINAGQHIVNEINNDREISENIK